MTKQFDYEKEINDLECPEWDKSGLKYYIKKMNYSDKIKSVKDLEKIIKEFKELKL